MHQEVHQERPDLTEKIFDIVAEEKALPRFNIMQQIVNHVKSEGLQMMQDEATGISHFGLEIRMRAEGEIPTEIATTNSVIMEKLAQQLVMNIFKGMFTEIVHRVQTLQTMMDTSSDANPDVDSYIDYNDETLQMFTDFERYWNQPVPEEGATTEVQQREVPLETLLDSRIRGEVNNG